MTIREDEPRRTEAPRSPWAVAAALAMALCVTALLTSARTLASAEGMPYGPGRDAAVAAASIVDGIATKTALLAALADLGSRVTCVDINEHKITTRNGLGHMAKLGVGQIPTICIDGQVKFPSIIPDISTLIHELEARVREQKGT